MKLWKGRFTKEATSTSDQFNASIVFDQQLYQEDITGSIAHAKMLAKQGILQEEEAQKIITGLKEIQKDIEEDQVTFSVANEDIHMNIETLLTQRIGAVGKKLHTARSRNDQVALDFKLYVKKECQAINHLLENLLSTLKDLATRHQQTIMPGYTHLQRAQPITLGYHILAYYQMLLRDQSRFADCAKRADELPLGSGALAGTSYRTDRQFLAQELGFEKVTANALDSVSDRDYAIEFVHCCSLTMVHLSRFCEELVLWSSKEFDFIEIDDGYATGSSIMPQKKNPDTAELIRGKTGRVYGNLMNLFTIMKGLPLSYNKDMQEDKPPVFDSSETLKSCLDIFKEMISTITVKEETMKRATQLGYLNATDAADYLVGKGLAFRDCHHIIGALVLHCIEKNCAIEDLSLEELQSFSPLFEEDIFETIHITNCINSKKSQGSTSFDSIKEQLANL